MLRDVKLSSCRWTQVVQFCALNAGEMFLKALMWFNERGAFLIGSGQLQHVDLGPLLAGDRWITRVFLILIQVKNRTTVTILKERRGGVLLCELGSLGPGD